MANLSDLQAYLVGGAVRDQLLGLPVTDRDYVVTGETPEGMLQRGFKTVGKDFPVFLHPETAEEYALARTERKSGRGYQGFTFHTSPNLSIEDDLLRRDLTINAMALNSSHTLVDPFGGQQDIQQRILRHVSPAFAEDPLRVLRLARFKARFAPLEFSIAPETIELAKNLVNAGELQFLTPERVWLETRKALMLPHAPVYFETLRELGALHILFPEVNALFGIPQRAEYHPEVDTGLHTMLALQQACDAGLPLEVRWAVLVHDLGKALTPPEQWPRHLQHEHLGIRPVIELGERLKIPANLQKLALFTCKNHLLTHQIFELKPKTLWTLLQKADVLRRPELLEHFIAACQCDARGRLGMANRPYPQAAYLRQAAAALKTVDVKQLLADREESASPVTGEEIAALLEAERIRILSDFKQQYKNTLD